MQHSGELSVEDITSREWAHLTIGIWWRLAVLSVVVSVLGSIASTALAFAVSRALGPATETHDAIFIPLWIVLGLILSVVAAHWFLRWIITVEYGATRLAVVRDGPSRQNL